MRRLVICAVLLVGCSAKGDPTNDPRYNAAVMDAEKVAASTSKSEEETKAKLDAMLKGKTPEQIIAEHQKREGEREREKVYAENRLKEANELMEKGMAAYDKLRAESKAKDSDDDLTRYKAFVAFEDEHEAIRNTDRIRASKFFHDELVGKSLEDFTTKWSPKYKLAK